MKKVCFLIPTINAGGIETYLLRFIHHTAGKLDATIIVRTKSNKGELYEDYCRTGVTIRFMPLGYINLLKMWSYFRFFNKEKFDAVCDFSGNFGGISLFLSKLTNTKKRIAFYRLGSNHFRSTLSNKMYNYLMNRLVYQSASHIFANSDAGLRFFFPYRCSADKRFEVIRNGLDIDLLSFSQDKMELRDQLKIPRDAYVIVHTGRLDKSKNHSTMLKVAARIIPDCPHVFFVFCGRNTEQLQPDVDKLGVGKNIRLLGYRNDVLTILKMADLFYFPSITEGQPNSLIEAMLTGLPIVASNIDAIAECVPNDLKEQLVNPLDIDKTVEAILKAICSDKSPDYSDWAKEHFNAPKNFNKFYEHL